LYRVTLADELMTGCGHPVLGERGPASDDSRVVGVIRCPGAEGGKEIGELALVESGISEELRFRGCRSAHGHRLSPLLKGASHAKEEEVSPQRSGASP
jgi:hypothetical protein